MNTCNAPKVDDRTYVETSQGLEAALCELAGPHGCPLDATYSIERLAETHSDGEVVWSIRIRVAAQPNPPG